MPVFDFSGASDKQSRGEVYLHNISQQPYEALHAEQPIMVLGQYKRDSGNIIPAVCLPIR